MHSFARQPSLVEIDKFVIRLVKVRNRPFVQIGPLLSPVRRGLASRIPVITFQSHIPRSRNFRLWPYDYSDEQCY